MKPSPIDQCRSYLVAHALAAKEAHHKPPRLAVTISREAGAGAVTVGKLAAEFLEGRQRDPRYPWVVFDRNLITKVLEDHAMPERLEEYMPEDTSQRVLDAIEDLLGLHPPSSTLVRITTDTILRLALIGNAVIVGRGGNLITSMLDHVLHVRLIAPVDVRIRRVASFQGTKREEAREYVIRTDRARARYVRRHFGKDIRDPLHYHLTINTEFTGFSNAAKIIADAAWAMRRDRA